MGKKLGFEDVYVCVSVIRYVRSRTSWEPYVEEVEAFRMEDLDEDGRKVEDWRDLVGFGVVGRLGRLGHQEDEGQFHWVLAEDRRENEVGRIQDRHRDHFAVEAGGRGQMGHTVGSGVRLAAVMGEGLAVIVRIEVVAAAVAAAAPAMRTDGIGGAVGTEGTWDGRRATRLRPKVLVQMETRMNHRLGRVWRHRIDWLWPLLMVEWMRPWWTWQEVLLLIGPRWLVL